MRLIILFALTLFPLVCMTAEWRVTQSIDAMTDKDVKLAYVVNDAGYQLSIRRSDKGSVWATFRLPRDSLQVIDSRLGLTYRIDKHPAVDVKKDRDIEKYVGALFVDGPQWISWRIFSGKGPADRGALRMLMDGSEILIRHFPLHEGSEDIRFSLAGAKEVIALAMNIPIEGDPAAGQREAEWSAARSAGTKACLTRPNRELHDCIRKNNLCSKTHPEDPAALKDCLGVQ